LKHYDETVTEQHYVRKIKRLANVECDRCHKIIPPSSYRNNKSAYIHVHTFHNDWGNDSCESHVDQEYCKECAIAAVTEYLTHITGSEELELSIQYVSTRDFITDDTLKKEV